MNWDHLRTILWLRWRLTRNQLRRSGGLNTVLTMIIIAFGVTIGIGGGFAGLLAGALAMKNISPSGMLILWDVITGIFLFVWMIGIVSEIQRSETIDTSRMMHLPISLKEIFLVNYIASHLNLTLIIFVPGMIGLSVGLALGKSRSMIFLLPLVIGFVFMITAWTYCLRGWLVRLMVNKRRRRTIVAIITFVFIIIGQLPNFFANVMPHHGHSLPSAIEQTTQGRHPNPFSSDPAFMHTLSAAHKIIPFLWVANGAMSLAKSNIWPAILGAAGTFLIGGLGILKAYRATIRFYQGQAIAKTASLPKKKKTVAIEQSFLERRIVAIPHEASALAVIFFRCLVRAPEIKIALASNFIMLLIFGGMMFVRHSTTVSEGFKPLITTGAIAVIFFGMIQLFFNQFGYDRAGFRTLVLLPVPRKYILLGKNLSLLPIISTIGVILIAIIKFSFGISFIIVIAAAMQLLAAFLLLSMAGNLSSIYAPYRIAQGSLKPTKVPAMMTFLIILTHMLFPMLIFPIFLPPALGLLFSSLEWLPAAAVNLIFSVLILALAAFFYLLSLKSLGRLMQLREMKILQVVTQEIE